MKNKYVYMAMLAMGTFFVSCEPEKIDGPDAWSSVAADKLELTVTPVQVNGKNSNEFIVENKSGINSQWIVSQLIEGNTVTAAAYAKMYATQVGNKEVIFHGFNGGEIVEKVLTVQVDTITYLTNELKSRLCIGQTGAPAYFGVSFDKARIVVEQSVCTNGKKGNSITVKSNLNPVLCTFKWGGGAMETNIGKLTTYALGSSMPLTVDILTASGRTETVNLGQYSAEDYSDLPVAITQLTGYHPIDSPNATKTWKLADGNHWGNGSYGDKSASWWTTTVDGQGGSTGSMTFNFAAGTLAKVIDNPANERGDKSGTGTFSLDFSTAAGNIICTLKTGGTGNIVFPYLINENYKETRIFQVVTLTNDDLWLCAQHTDPSNSEGTFWHFQPVKGD